MSTQHTPGPWRFGKRSDDVVADVNAGHPQDQESMDFYGGHLVAESIAPRNRALIAAAPELLDALSSLASQHSEADLREDPDLHAAVKRARAAIAKATGGAA